ncbi:MAG TPA: TIGR03842 family LLM class F420-dependent oxidoreductase [Actinomycetes bacterium]|jgi:probable F420-dependent oxidoreductase|nr:TIGR03842 family LLM class F420-dependent oxidoreductase [Actinomycetes bacterium]
MLELGVCFSADPPPSRMVELTRAAEEAGFRYAWAWDSHVLWQDVYPIFALMAKATSRIGLGPCVTNPATRDPTVTASTLATLNDISGNRMEMGIGRGDSARRVIGQPPVTVGRMEWAAKLIKDLAEGRPVTYDGTEIQLKWAKGTLPVWIAAYGPRALRLAGRIGDGVILQLADPHVIQWLLRWVREGAEEAGRRFEEVKVMAAAPAYVSSDLERAREQVRWFPALVSNHVVDLVNRYPREELPQELTAYIATRDHYDYAEHGRVGAEHASFVSDEVVDRFCVIGTLEDCERRLRELEAVGVHQFNIYSMVDDPDGVIRTFGKELIPSLTGSRPAT